MATPNTTTTLHVIAVPYPGRGHVNPMLIFSRLLAARLPPPAVLTVVLTEEWLSLVGGPAAAPPGVRFQTLPNVIPSEKGRAADIVKFMEAVYTKLEEPFEKLLDELDTAATAIVADTYLPWVVDVGKRRGVPVCSLYTMSANFFSAILNYDRLPGETGFRHRRELRKNMEEDDMQMEISFDGVEKCEEIEENQEDLLRRVWEISPRYYR